MARLALRKRLGDRPRECITVVGVDDCVVATLLATGITQVLLDRRQTLKDQKILAKAPIAVALPTNSENA